VYIPDQAVGNCLDCYCKAHAVARSAPLQPAGVAALVVDKSDRVDEESGKQLRPLDSPIQLSSADTPDATGTSADGEELLTNPVAAAAKHRAAKTAANASNNGDAVADPLGKESKSNKQRQAKAPPKALPTRPTRATAAPVVPTPKAPRGAAAEKLATARRSADHLDLPPRNTASKKAKTHEVVVVVDSPTPPPPPPPLPPPKQQFALVSQPEARYRQPLVERNGVFPRQLANGMAPMADLAVAHVGGGNAVAPQYPASGGYYIPVPLSYTLHLEELEKKRATEAAEQRYIEALRLSAERRARELEDARVGRLYLFGLGGAPPVHHMQPHHPPGPGGLGPM